MRDQNGDPFYSIVDLSHGAGPRYSHNYYQKEGLISLYDPNGRQLALKQTKKRFSSAVAKRKKNRTIMRESTQERIQTNERPYATDPLSGEYNLQDIKTEFPQGALLSVKNELNETPQR